MDFASAALLSFAVFVVTGTVKRIVPSLTGWALNLLVAVIGVGVTFLVAFSDYGKTQIVGKIPMNDMNIASLILVGLIVGGGANVIHQVVGSTGAIANIGANKGDVPAASTVVAEAPLPELELPAFSTEYGQQIPAGVLSSPS